MRLIDADALIEFCAERWIPLNIDAVNMQPTIQPEKTQLFKEGTTKDTTSDLISRMETVEHLRRVLDATVPITDYDEGYVDGVEFGISTVSTMPTIQSQSTVGQLNDGSRSTAQSTDLIDRQAAIDAVNNAFDRETLLTGFVRSIAVRAIRDMPSVQPEYEEVTPEEAASEIASGSIMSARSWLNVMIQLKQMGYAICRKK